MRDNALRALPPLEGARFLLNLEAPGNPALRMSSADVDVLLRVPHLEKVVLPAAAVPRGAPRLKRGRFQLQLVA